MFMIEAFCQSGVYITTNLSSANSEPQLVFGRRLEEIRKPPLGKTWGLKPSNKGALIIRLARVLGYIVQ